MFVDRVRIKLSAGGGGNGCVSFRREKYVAKGGPNGGDGGDGGDIILKADSQTGTLVHLKFHPIWLGHRGVHGRGSDQHGKRGEDIVIEVPVGTVIKDPFTGELICDLSEEGQVFIGARGGRGGKGNARFSGPNNRVPRFAEHGEPGEEREFDLDLKLIADIGIVGLPNAGKSTFLSVISAATPKIGAYPFTTIHPNLGVVTLSGHRSFTVADIPGIIEGAAHGKGLGLDFLRHIERTKALLFLIDGSDADPLATYKLLLNELDEYSPVFGARPSIVAITKADIPANREAFDRVNAQFDEVRLISSATGDGVPELLEDLWTLLVRAREAEANLTVDEPAASAEFRYESPFEVQEAPGGFVVQGKRVVRAVRMTDFSNDEAIKHLEYKLKKMGLFKALKRLGAEEGASVFIGETELEYHAD